MADLNTIKGLALKISATRLHLGVLAGVAAFWPVLVLVAVFVLLALGGVFEAISPSLGAISALIVLLGGAGLVWRGARCFAWPSEGEARRALDFGSDLRPIASLTDRPAEVTRDGLTLWVAHGERLKKAAAGLTVPTFGRVWAKLDPYYLRAVLPGVLALGLIVTGEAGLDRIGRAIAPDYGVLVGADNVRVEAWITPPEHTRKPPIFLQGSETADGEFGSVRVPAGSEVTVRAQARSAPKLVLRGEEKTRRRKFEATPDGAYEIKAEITEDTTLSVNWWGRRAGGIILASPDALPKAEFVEVPKLGPNDQTEFTYAVADDYGVAKLELALRLVEPHPAAPEDERRVSIELPGPSLAKATEEAAIDMTRHAWAGLQVEARLVATDGAGQEGYSAPHEFLLPEKLFLQTLARAAQDIRVTALREPREYEQDWEINRLEVAPEGIQRAALMLEAVTYEPYRFFANYELFLGFSTAEGMLKAARSTTQAQEIEGLLWAVALKAEYGSSADALAALLAAKKALEKALRDGATEEEIARLTEAFRQAAQNYVQAKLAEALANGLPEGADPSQDGQQAGGGGPSLGQNSFEDMLNALEDLTQTGATDQARQLLSDITNMLENLEFQQGQSGGSGGDGFSLPSEGGEEGEQSEEQQAQQELADEIEELSEALREQRELNDDTQEAEQSRRGQQGGGQSEGGQPQSGEGGGAQDGETGEGLSNEELADRQGQIGRLLEELAENGVGSGEEGDEQGAGGNGELLEELLRAERRAENALRDGQLNRAQRNQTQITDGLRALAGQLAEELDARRDEDSQQTDPFGNPIGGNGGSDDVKLPESAERQRALDILEELRRRYEEASDPEEREYLKRLLDRF